MAEYKAELPPGVNFSGRIDTADPRYRALVDLATREGWSQAAFSGVLAIEAQRVGATQPAAAKPAPAPAPAPAPGKVDGWDQMSATQRMAYAVAQSDARRAERGNQP
jgi:hypothetical protein